MALRIREVVIRAEIGNDVNARTARTESGQPRETQPETRPESLTHRFYEQDLLKVNER